MAAKKPVAKKKKAKARKKGSKKQASAKAARASAKKSAKKASRKKTSSKRSAKKQARKPSGASKKKTSKKKASARKAPVKKVSKKKVTKKVGSKKATKKKAASKKKTSKKKTASSTKRTASGKKTAAGASRKKTAARPAPAKQRAPNVLVGPVRGFTPYQPKRGETYMSAAQLEHFRQILLAWKRELMEEVDRTMHHMKDDAANFPDPNDRATQESEFGLELRTRDRERKLLKKIDQALERIDDGTYGYCEETGDEIGLRRLEARPVATLCVEAQERRELAERQFRDREDYYR